MRNAPANFFDAILIASVLDCSKRTALRRAARERWPRRINGNQFLFKPPGKLAARCRRLTHHFTPRGICSALITLEQRASALRTMNRLSAVLLLLSAVDSGEGNTVALGRIAKLVSFSCSPRALHSWTVKFSQNGIEGLIERRVGRCGKRKGPNHG